MKDKNKLINTIKRKFVEGRSEVQDFVRKKLVAEGRLNNYILNSIIMGDFPIETLNINILIWIAEALNQFDEKICNPSDYFEPIEIDNVKMYVYPIDDLDDYLTFSNVFELAQDQYLCTASVKQIGILRRNSIIKPYFEAQRDSITRTFGEGEIKVIKINSNRVNEISEKIDSDSYAYNEIRLNLLKDSDTGLPRINYDSKNRTIKIN
jgi:hypothetical protein